MGREGRRRAADPRKSMALYDEAAAAEAAAGPGRNKPHRGNLWQAASDNISAT